jgi:hypothetical protein
MDDFCRLLEAEIPRLRRYAHALTRNASRADDLVQDTLTRALGKRNLWEPGSDLRAWMFTIIGVPARPRRQLIADDPISVFSRAALALNRHGTGAEDQRNA